MGAINYGPSRYITMGIKPCEPSDLLADADFREWINEEYNFRPEDNESEAYGIAADVAQDYDREDKDNAERLIETFGFFEYYHIAVKPGYYEGFYIDIENNRPIAFDSWEDRREAQKEISRIKKMLLTLADCGLCSVWPGWCTTYRDRSGTREDINKAIREMREEARSTPTWAQYERGESFSLADGRKGAMA